MWMSVVIAVGWVAIAPVIVIVSMGVQQLVDRVRTRHRSEDPPAPSQTS